MVLVGIGTLAARRIGRTCSVEELSPRSGQMGDLNRLLQEGSITPEDYELMKRRILAGQVH
jgi:hypothetical protein